MTSDAARPSHRFPIIGIGASAGGIPALEGFFKGLDGADGMAFVVVTHLSPDRESMLHEVIARYTELPMHVTEDGESPEPGNVYVMPQNAILTIAEGQFEIRRPNAANRERKPIDIFFAALAKDRGEYAAGVVLSGGDGDGTLGIKAIKERGGLTLAQVADGSGPRNPDMPTAAISSGLVDLALPAEEMGARLIEFSRSFEVVERLEDSAGDGGDPPEARKLHEAIYALLRGQAGHDFSGYKSKTFLRRVHRRMQVVQATTIDAYVERLRRDPAEVMNLFRDLLINVTNFFRDREAFQALAQRVVPKLFEGRGASDTIRVWVPGCATGEEVYSLAILMREHMATLAVVPRVQIFATDIDEAALSVARAGRYPAPLLEGLETERLQRFFTTDGASYAVNKDVRDLCIFSPHSVIRDPPFSRMDLVSCRNLLIYFGPEIQHQVVPTFHYALKPGGYLFLGTSESITRHADLFSTLDKKHRIFQRRDHASQVPRLPTAITSRGAAKAVSGSPNALPGTFPLRQAIEAHVLERFAPAHVVINADGDVVYYSAGTGRFLEAAQGAPNRQLLAMARKGLRLDLRAAMREAMETRGTATRNNVIVEGDDDWFQPVSLTIEPLPERGQGEPLYLVLFTPMNSPQNRQELSAADRVDREDVVSDLELELRDTRERLQSTIEEYETALEELKSSNEELVSVNEEAQSTNEELEASKEEMQSLNEELNTINAELAGKLEDLDRANSDLRNLFESTQIATIFLDRNLVIRNFTPAASRFFNLRTADIGRPLTELASYLDFPQLKENIQQVFESGEPVEHQVPRDANERHYLARLIPYRDENKRIDGVVVTFIDVTRLAEAEDQQRVLIAELNHRVKNMLAVIISLAAQSRRGATTLDEFANSLHGRLQAMARAYGTLSRENWQAIAAGAVIRQELEPFDINRVIVRGDAMSLPPQAGLSLGMVIHELATNAVKYGALSRATGRIEVAWSPLAGAPGLHLVWTEGGGPAVKEDLQEGFGLRLIRGEIEHRHGGRVTTEFRPEELRVTIDLPFGTPSDA